MSPNLQLSPKVGAHPGNKKGPSVRSLLLLGYLDSNQEQLNQNQPCCQLHHTPMALTGIRAVVYPSLSAGRLQNGPVHTESRQGEAVA